VTNDSGKHGALRQTGDGSFEFVVDEGLLEIAEDPSSSAEPETSTTTSEARQRGGSSRGPILAIGGIAVLALVAAISWAFLQSGDEDAGTDASRETAGFKPYAGGAESDSRPNTPRPEPRVAAAEPEEPEESADEVIEEEEDPGWELSESGIVVEDEGVPDEEVEEITEDEEIPPDVLAQERPEPEEADPQKQRRLDALRNLGSAIPSPNAPSLGKTPSIFGRKPIRAIDPATGNLRKMEDQAAGIQPEAEEEGVQPEGEPLVDDVDTY
jgi:hypothetical protein